MIKKILFSGSWCFILITFFLSLLISGCTGIQGHKQDIKQVEKSFKVHKCKFKKFNEKIKNNEDVIFWSIYGGAIARECKKYKESNKFFDEAEKRYKTDVDLDTTGKNIVETTKAIFVNENVNDYEGNVYEKIMVNVYKGLNFLSLNDIDNARVEFNRALDRQRRAKDFFKKEIKARQEKIKNDNVTKIAQNPKTQKVIYDKYQDIFKGFRAYPDFVNPFATYISGLFFLLTGEPSKASHLLKEVISMEPNNTQAREDFKLCNKAASRIKKLKSKYVWIIYENGKGMVKKELRIDVPLFILTSKAYYTGIAFPKLKERKSSYKYLVVNDKKTVLISNMDNVIKAEFKKRFPSIVMETVMSTIVKTLATQQSKKKLGSIGGLLGSTYHAVTNKADVRCWSTLPKNFQVARIKATDKPIIVKDETGKIITSVNLPKNKNSILYIKSFERGNNVIHKIIF